MIIKTMNHLLLVFRTGVMSRKRSLVQVQYRPTIVYVSWNSLLSGDIPKLRI